MPTADMNMIVQYARHAIIAISEYAAQYGPNTVTVSPTVLTHTVSVPSASYSDGDLQGWVNDIVSENGLGSDSCIFVVSPQGLSASNVGGNAGYHGKANVPYVVAGVFATGLTLRDDPDVYAMVVSHEIAEMVVDPNVDGANPEVCDPCDINCGNLTRIYFDASDNFLGINQQSPPGGFNFTYYICSVVKPDGAADCPASSANCNYAPVTQDCQLIIEKSTYGQDEVEVNLPGTASYTPAFWVALDGFTAAELGFQQPSDLNNANPTPAPAVTLTLDPTLNSSLTNSQLNNIGANLPTVSFARPVVPEDPTLQQLTQRFLYPYILSFNGDGAFTPLQLDQAVLLTLNATFTVGQVTRSASANIMLVKGENPYYENVQPDHPQQPFWLSYDLRFFKMIVPQGQIVSRFGANMSSDPGDAPGFIAQVIQNLTQNSGSAGGETFEGLSQDEEVSALEFLRRDNDGNFVFNFALARVRLLGKTAGAQAVSTRVFFRLFQAQTAATEFDENTTYRFASDGALNGHKIPLLGVQNDEHGNPEYVTVPCFATVRVNRDSPAAMDTQNDPPNVQTINVDPNVEVDTFFGCWLDVNQPQQNFLPLTPPAGNFDGPWNGITLKSLNQVITRAPHQCLIAEIRYDDAPIPPGASPATSDKLAQRNIGWIDGPNPGDVESRRMPHPFEVAASPADATTPDELMILWGNTPAGSRAELYLPAVSGAQVLQLADSMYMTHQLTLKDQNTIQCPAGGATFVPVPAGTARNAGLLTVELPDGIQKGDRYDISVRQVTEDGYEPPPIITRAAPPVRKGDLFTWRRVNGAFQIAIVISTRQQLLLREERLLAWLRWIMQTMPTTSRWYPVWQRYVDLIGGRVRGFGGDPDHILPSPDGPSVPPAKGECACWVRWLIPLLLAPLLVLITLAPPLWAAPLAAAGIILILAAACYWYLRCKPAACDLITSLIMGIGVAELVLGVVALLGYRTLGILLMLAVLGVVNCVFLIIAFFRGCCWGCAEAKKPRRGEAVIYGKR